MPEPLAYLNGQFIPQSEAHLSFADAGFVFGATVTDLGRTFQHRLYRLADHLARFRHSCTLARIAQPISDGELTKIATRLVDHNSGSLKAQEDLALVMFATPGIIGYLAGQKGGLGDSSPTLGMHTFPLPLARYARWFREGAHLVVPARRQVPALCVDPRIKQRSRLHWWLAEHEAQQLEPGAAALLLDTDGHVTETAVANFLIVRQGVVMTPLKSSILGGISLKVIEEICQDLDIKIEERALTLEECQDADEAMLASTPFCLAGVSRINGIGIKWPGPITERLLTAWSRNVGLDIKAQFLSAEPAEVGVPPSGG